MRKAGLTLREIGEYMGVSTEQARQLYEKALRTKLSPIEDFGEWSAVGLTTEYDKPTLQRMIRALELIIHPVEPVWPIDEEWFPARCA